MSKAVLALGAGVWSAGALAGPLHVCVDKNPAPPFVYSEKINGAGQLKGYSLDLVKQVLAGIGRPYDVKSYTRADIDKKIQAADANAGCDLILDVPRTGAPASVLLTSQVYQLNYDLVYSWERYMTGLPVKTVADLGKYQVCGVADHDYGSLGKQLKIKRAAHIKEAVFELGHKTCDVFIAEAAVMKYGQRTNSYQVPPVGCMRLNGTTRTYHIGVAKHVPGADALLGQMQQKLAQLAVKGGAMDQLAEAYDIVPMTCQYAMTVAP